MSFYVLTDVFGYSWNTESVEYHANVSNSRMEMLTGGEKICGTSDLEEFHYPWQHCGFSSQ
jgi:hypothetical protein